MKSIHIKTARLCFIRTACAFLAVLCCRCAALADTLALPSSLRAIGEEAFCGDTSLEDVILPDGLREIGKRAFADSVMSSITLPTSIAFIDDTAFTGAKFDWIVATPDTYAYDWMVRHKYIQPQITAYAENESVVSGGTVTLRSETLYLSGKTEYLWQSSAGEKVWSGTEFNGNDSETLTFTATPDTLKYYYRCRVRDNNGYWYSNPVRVKLAPRIEASADHKTALYGVYVGFSATVTDAKGACAYQWQYGLDGENWYDITTIPDADKSAFSLFSSENNLRYLYRCAVTDDNGVWYSKPVSVTFSPLRIVADPQSGTAVVDDRVTFSVEAEGYEPLSYQWQVRFPGESDWHDSVLTSSKTAQVRFTASDHYNGVQYRCRVTNGYGDSLYSEAAALTVTPKPVYRARMVAMGNFLRQDSKIPNSLYFIHYGYERPYFYVESIQRNYRDAQGMCGMLNGVYGGKTPGAKYDFKWYQDSSYEGMRQMLQTEFADTTEYDVSLFFVATHGYSNGDGDLELSFFGGLNQQDIEAHMKGKRSLSFDTLASWLKQYVKGDIIVIIQSCGAGSAIYSSTGVQNGAMAKESLDDAEDEFLSRAIEAFARADAEEAPRSGDSANGTGAMRQSRFYVLAASRHHELSWGSESKGYNYFTKWLTEGVGTSGNMPADTNNDGVVTLTELFNYIKQYNTYGIKSSDDGKIYYQHVQRYPVGSQYPLFR